MQKLTGLWGIGLVAIGLAVSCGDNGVDAVDCGNGTVCTSSQICMPAGGCAVSAQQAACANMPANNACTFNNQPGVCADGFCILAPLRCGDGVIQASNGEQCDDGNNDDLDGCRNNCQPPRCGDGIASRDESCDAGGNTASCDFNCSLPLCGDGLVNNQFLPAGAPGPEVCDDGNQASGDGCSPLCQIETCGNGVVDTANDELCDDGNDDDLDDCRPNCQLPRCGDNIVSSAETCDAGGNTADCNFTCTRPLCGDGLVNNQFLPAGATSPEVCDDGNQVDGDGCSALCQIETCGNGVVEAANSEQCDDGNADDLDGCRTNCQLPRCGDGIRSVAESCDTSGNTAECNFNCSLPLCGDGLVNNQFIPAGATSPEVCDDGNQLAGDGCSPLCQIETCGNGVIEAAAGEQCDDGNSNDGDACRNNCQLPRCGDNLVSNAENCDTGGNTADCNFNCARPQCGDGLVNNHFIPNGATSPEVCDDGNQVDGDGCSALCQIEACGNGVTEAANGEQCDDANTNDLDGCRNNCQLPRCSDGIKSASEFCDTSGNSTNCDFDCTRPQCGDGVINKLYLTARGPEQCDDGGVLAGDGCSDYCQIESCGNGRIDFLNGEQCDDQNDNDFDNCRNNCQMPRCGDGIVSLSEICDTGGNSATCNFNCTVPQCGDRLVNSQYTPPGAPDTEACDLGGNNGTTACSATCQLPW